MNSGSNQAHEQFPNYSATPVFERSLRGSAFGRAPAGHSVTGATGPYRARDENEEKDKAEVVGEDDDADGDKDEASGADETNQSGQVPADGEADGEDACAGEGATGMKIVMGDCGNDDAVEAQADDEDGDEDDGDDEDVHGDDGDDQET